MPSIIMPEQPWTSISISVASIHKFAHTLANYSSSFSWTKGQQTLKFGGEQRLFYNNFFQPNYPNGYFSFDQDVTAQVPFDTNNGIQGNSFAGLLLGYGDSGSINVTQSVADKSKETGFYVQDDWRVNKKLTLNLGCATSGAAHTPSVTTIRNSATSLAAAASLLPGSVAICRVQRSLPPIKSETYQRIGTTSLRVSVLPILQMTSSRYAEASVFTTG